MDLITKLIFNIGVFIIILGLLIDYKIVVGAGIWYLVSAFLMHSKRERRLK